MGGICAVNGVFEESCFSGGVGGEATMGVALPPIPEVDWTPAPSPPDSKDTADAGPNLTSSANTHFERNSTNFKPAPMVTAWVHMGSIMICRGICD